MRVQKIIKEYIEDEYSMDDYDAEDFIPGRSKGRRNQPVYEDEWYDEIDPYEAEFGDDFGEDDVDFDEDAPDERFGAYDDDDLDAARTSRDRMRYGKSYESDIDPDVALAMHGMSDEEDAEDQCNQKATKKIRSQRKAKINKDRAVKKKPCKGKNCK